MRHLEFVAARVLFDGSGIDDVHGIVRPTEPLRPAARDSLAHNPLALEPRRALDDLVHERIGVPAVDVRYGIADAEGLGQAVDGEGGDLDRAVPRPSFICLRDPQPLAVSGRV